MPAGKIPHSVRDDNFAYWFLSHNAGFCTSARHVPANPANKVSARQSAVTAASAAGWNVHVSFMTSLSTA